MGDDKAASGSTAPCGTNFSAFCIRREAKFCATSMAGPAVKRTLALSPRQHRERAGPGRSDSCNWSKSSPESMDQSSPAARESAIRRRNVRTPGRRSARSPAAQGAGKVEFRRRQDIDAGHGTQLVLPGAQRCESTFDPDPVELGSPAAENRPKKPLTTRSRREPTAPAIGFMPLNNGGAPEMGNG